MNGNVKNYVAVYEEDTGIEIKLLHTVVKGCDPAQANRKFDTQFNPTKTNRELVAVIDFNHFKEEMFPGLK